MECSAVYWIKRYDVISLCMISYYVVRGNHGALWVLFIQGGCGMVVQKVAGSIPRASTFSRPELVRSEAPMQNAWVKKIFLCRIHGNQRPYRKCVPIQAVYFTKDAFDGWLRHSATTRISGFIAGLYDTNTL